MNSFFHENKRNAFILLGLVFLLLIFIYGLFYLPLSKELNFREDELQRVEENIKLLEVNIANATDTGTEEENIKHLGLVNKMPMDPELEEIILTLEEIELISNSRFDNIEFTYDGSIPERAAELEEVEEREETTEEESLGEIDDEIKTAEETSEPDLETVINMEEKPENLQVINVSLNVSSPDYEHLQTFIQEIEKQERMMMVSSMEFDKLGEEDLLFEEEADESIITNLTITTFYYAQ